MDEFEVMIANLRRLRSDVERLFPSDSTEEILKKLDELRQRMESIQQPSDPRRVAAEP